MVHSLSKYLHLSHLRCGFSLCADYELGQQMKHHCPLGSELEGALMATEALEADGPIRPLPDVLDAIRENGRLIAELCSKAGFSSFDLTSNFALLRLPSHLTSQGVCQELAKDNVLVLGAHELHDEEDDWIRVHVASPRPAVEELLARLAALTEAPPRGPSSP